MRTDYQALVWLFSLKEPRGKIARWIEILSHDDFSLEYRPGKKQAHCDALSRCEDPRSCDCSFQNTEEPLKCGPCKKCQKRAQEMVHKELFIRFTASAFRKLPSIYVFSYFPFGLEDRMWDLIVSVPDHYLSFYFVKLIEAQSFEAVEGPLTEDNQPMVKGIGSRDDEVPGPSSQGDDEKKRSKRDETLAASVIAEKFFIGLQKAQNDDTDIGLILRAKMTNNRPTSKEMSTKSPAARQYWLLWDNLEIHNDGLFKRFVERDGTGEYLQLIVPQSLKSEILHQMHDSVVSGH